MAKGARWPMQVNDEGGFDLTDTPQECTDQELGVGLTSELSAHEWGLVSGRDVPPLAYATGPDGGRGVAMLRASTVFAEKTRDHRAELVGTPTLRQDGATIRLSVRYRSIEEGGELKTREV